MVIGLRILSKEIISNIELRLRKLLSEIAHACNNLARVAILEDPSAKSARILQVSNILIILAMVLMSPEKITQMIMPSESGSLMADGIRNSLKLIRKLTPF